MSPLPGLPWGWLHITSPVGKMLSMLRGAAGWVKSYFRCLWCADSVAGGPWPGLASLLFLILVHSDVAG